MLTWRRMLTASLRFHWRSHLGVVLGAAVGSAALIGALVVGDSVRESLVERALARLGEIEVALDSGDRLFRVELGSHPANRVESGTWAWSLRGAASRQDGTARAHGVRILAVPPGFKTLAPGWSAFQNDRLGRPPVSRGGPPGTSPDPRLPADVEAAIGEHLAELRRPDPGKVRLNEALAEQLGAKPGDEVILRFAKPSALSADAVLSPRNEAAAVLRLEVEDVVSAAKFGEFALRSGSGPVFNAFVHLDDLQRAAGVTNRANLLLVPRGRVMPEPGEGGWRAKALGRLWTARSWMPDAFYRPLYALLQPRRGGTVVEAEATLRHAESQLAARWQLADAEIDVQVVEPPMTATGGDWVPPFVEVATRRIFLDPVVTEAARRPATNLAAAGTAAGRVTASETPWVTNGLPVLTYLANGIRRGERLAPYSMVTAAGAPWTPADLKDDEIVLGEWLAKDLGAKPGDRVVLTYFDPEAGARLLERTNEFRVRSVVPLRGYHGDRTLMPEFPGLSKAESTSDWDAGFPLVHKIRDEDEAYWKQHRGTPKAFVSLAAGRAMWANRFGDATAVRYFVGTNAFASGYRNLVAANLRANLRPAEVGLAFQPVRRQALLGATSGQDFGQLFLGFSFFLVLSALLLMALLFRFGLEQRLPEVGTLVALGWRPRTIRRLWLAEGIALAWVGGGVGVVGGLYYAQALVGGLTTVWRAAIGGTALGFHARPASLVLGLAASVAVAAVAIWLTLRRQFARPPRELLAGEVESAQPGRRSRGRWIAGVAGLGAAGLAASALVRGDTANAGVFFGAGSLVLIGGLAAWAAWLGREERIRGTGELTPRGLALRGMTRRRSRSLATAGLLASGTFLVVAIGAFRMDARRGAWERSAGTGGFALIAEGSLPVAQDLNTEAGLEAFGLGTTDLPGVRFVPFRVRDGDDASCLNLDRAQRPRLLGVRPELLAERRAFAFAQLASGVTADAPWQALRVPASAARTGGTGGTGGDSEGGAGPEEIPAIGDAASIQWALGKKIGDTLEVADERGRTVRLRLVGGVANSILQGSLVIDEAAFTRLYPGEGGHRYFLIDTPTNQVDAASRTLSRAFQDAGWEVAPAVRRLERLNAVQNTYLTTFQMLGGLGLLLGSAGLGVVVLRNVLERRGELALLTAVGFPRRQLARLVLLEHAALLAVGLAIGVGGAVVAVLPSILAPTVELPVRSLGATLLGVAGLGLLTAWGAVRVSLRGPLLAALRGA